LQTPCVIKQFIPPAGDASQVKKSMALFQQEASLLKILGQHPHIPALLAFLKQDDHLYLIQEFIDGQDLFQEAMESGPFSAHQVQVLFTELLPILQFIHNHQVVHRDIKPGNLLRQRDGSLVLIDFGGSLQLEGHFRPVTGTPGYAPPEQLKGHVKAASDLHSLAVTGMRLLTGHLAQEDADPFEDPYQRHQIWHQLSVNLSPELTQIFDNLLQPDIRNRYQSALEVWHVLNPTVAVPRPEQQPVQLPLVPPPLSMPIAPTMLNSEVGVNYTHLKALLSQQNYAAADQETWKLMLQATGTAEVGALDIQAIQTFPLMDLATLDFLWTELSGGHFGFSVQQHIYQRLGGTSRLDYAVWQNFAQQVGWYEEEHWQQYDNLNFAINAPSGQLPACFADKLNRLGMARGVCGWWRLGFIALIRRLELAATP